MLQPPALRAPARRRALPACASGLPRAEQVAVRLGRGGPRARTRGPGRLERRAAVAARRRLRVRARRPALARTHARACSRTACAGRRASSTRTCDVDAIGAGRPRPATTPSTTNCTSPRSPRRHVRARDPAPRSARRHRASRPSSCCPSRSSPGSAAGAMTACTRGRRTSPTAGPTGWRGSSTRRTGHGIAVVLDIVPNHVGASGEKALRAFGPYFTGPVTRRHGARAISFHDADWERCASGCCERVRVLGARHARGRPAARCDPRDLGHRAPSTWSRRSLAACTRRDPARRRRSPSRPERPGGDPAAERGGYDCDAAWADDFHHALRVPLTSEREGYYVDFGRSPTSRRHSTGRSCMTAPTRRSAAAASARPRMTAAGAVRRLRPEPRPGRQPRFGDRLPRRRPAARAFCTLLSPFTPMLFMGEEYGEPAPFQFFSDHIDKRIAKATREGRRREFAAFARSPARRSPTRRTRRRSRRSKLTRERDPALARALARRCWSGAAAAAGRRRRGAPSTTPRGGCAYAAGSSSCC